MGLPYGATEERPHGGGWTGLLLAVVRGLVRQLTLTLPLPATATATAVAQ